jgi:hypothetical protein
MKQAVIKWLKMGVFFVLAFLLLNYGAWPKNREPAPSLSLASAWFCEKFANGVGIDVQRDGLKIMALNPDYKQYRLDFFEDGAWQIKGTLSALLILAFYMAMVGRFTALGLTKALGMILAFHVVRLALIAVFPIIVSFDFIDNATRMGYIILTSLSTISFSPIKRELISAEPK